MPENTTAKELYAQREKRVLDTIALKKPDRVPLVSMSEFFLPTSQGLTVKEAMYDYERAGEAFKNGLSEFQWDMSPHTYTMFPGRVMDKMELTCFSWPGAEDEKRRAPDNSSYQYIEKEYMRENEYDAFFKDPTDYSIKTILPRLSTIFSPLADFPYPIPFMAHPYGVFQGLPKVAGVFSDIGRKMVEAGEELAKWQASQEKLNKEIIEMGFPLVENALITCAFDLVGDLFRGMKGTMLDMFRRPTELMDMVHYFEPYCIQAAIASAKQTGSQRVFIPLHKGADGFMNPKQFDEMYWPQLKRLFLALIDADLTPMPFFEGNYTSRVDYLAQLPPGKILGHFDAMDRNAYKEKLSHVMPFWGDIPGGLLMGGSQEEVRNYVKELIDFFPDGGLIVDGSSAGFPVEAKKENVMAVTETVFEYGHYS